MLYSNVNKTISIAIKCCIKRAIFICSKMEVVTSILFEVFNILFYKLFCKADGTRIAKIHATFFNRIRNIGHSEFLHSRKQSMHMSGCIEHRNNFYALCLSMGNYFVHFTFRKRIYRWFIFNPFCIIRTIFIVAIGVVMFVSGFNCIFNLFTGVTAYSHVVKAEAETAVTKSKL